MPQKNVLFVNNDPKVQGRVKEVLSDYEDYNLIIANTTERAYSILMEGNIDFVLFDVDVALEEGVNKLLEMKEKYPDIPIVATTPIRRTEVETQNSKVENQIVEKNNFISKGKEVTEF